MMSGIKQLKYLNNVNWKALHLNVYFFIRKRKYIPFLLLIGHAQGRGFAGVGDLFVNPDLPVKPSPVKALFF